MRPRVAGFLGISLCILAGAAAWAYADDDEPRVLSVPSRKATNDDVGRRDDPIDDEAGENRIAPKRLAPKARPRPEADPEGTPATLTVESAGKGKLRITQSIKGQKPLVMEIDVRDERFQMKYGEGTTIAADQLRIEFQDSEPVRISAQGDTQIVRMSGLDIDQVDADEVHTKKPLNIDIKGRGRVEWSANQPKKSSREPSKNIEPGPADDPAMPPVDLPKKP